MKIQKQAIIETLEDKNRRADRAIELHKQNAVYLSDTEALNAYIDNLERCKAQSQKFISYLKNSKEEEIDDNLWHCIILLLCSYNL